MINLRDATFEHAPPCMYVMRRRLATTGVAVFVTALRHV
jgi:hypothetical protein